MRKKRKNNYWIIKNKKVKREIRDQLIETTYHSSNFSGVENGKQFFAKKTWRLSSCTTVYRKKNTGLIWLKRLQPSLLALKTTCVLYLLVPLLFPRVVVGYVFGWDWLMRPTRWEKRQSKKSRRNPSRVAGVEVRRRWGTGPARECSTRRRVLHQCRRGFLCGNWDWFPCCVLIGLWKWWWWENEILGLK